MNNENELEQAVIHPPECIGMVDVSSDVLQIGDLRIEGVGSGYPEGAVYIQRISGKHRIRDGNLELVPGFPIAKIHIEIIGDSWSERELEAQNEEAMLHPLGPREYWRAKGLWDEDDNEVYEAWLAEEDDHEDD